MPDSNKPNTPDFQVSQIMGLPNRDKAKFYNVGVGFKSKDNSINIMIAHGTKWISEVTEKQDK